MAAFFLLKHSAMQNRELTYSHASRELLDQAGRELAAGDVRQATEKGWGAAAQMVKAVASRRGWQHNSHSLLYDVVLKLARETGDDDISTLFHTAGNLHTNFYENWLTGEVAGAGLRYVGQFLDKLEPGEGSRE